MHSDYDLKQEQLNKSSLLSSKKFLEGLMDIFTLHVVSILLFISKSKTNFFIQFSFKKTRKKAQAL